MVRFKLLSLVPGPPIEPANVPAAAPLTVNVENAALPPTMVPPEPLVARSPNVLLDGPDASPSTSRPTDVADPIVRPPAETTRLLPPARTIRPSVSAVLPE